MTFNEQISTTAKLLRQSQRPLFVWGAGMRPYRDKALALARSLGVPVACTWGAIDLINHDDPLACGGFGTHGTRAANLAVQGSDLVISLGCRLDTKATGTPSDFAPSAKLVMVDIDDAEIRKFDKLGRKIDLGICVDAGEFIDALRESLFNNPYQVQFPAWQRQCQVWRYENIPTGAPYDLMRRISEYTTPLDIIVSDTGNTLGWIMQGFPFKGERMVHAWNMTPMGYGLAGSIGASFASDNRVVCICGDGGALMSANELATIRRHSRNIKIIVLDNKAHGMCMVTQRQWLGGKYYATSIEGGLGFPDWDLLSKAFSIDVAGSLEELFSSEGPAFHRVPLDRDLSLAFQVKYGDPLA